MGRVHADEVLGPYAGESLKVKKFLLDAGLPFDITLVDAGADFLIYHFEDGSMLFELIWHNAAMAIRIPAIPPGTKNLAFVCQTDPASAVEPSVLRENIERFVEMAQTREMVSSLPLVRDNPEVFGIIESSSSVMLVDDGCVYELRFVEDHYHLLLHVLKFDEESPYAQGQLHGTSVDAPLHPVMVDAFLGLIAMRCGLNSTQELLDQLSTVLIPESLG